MEPANQFFTRRTAGLAAAALVALGAAVLAGWAAGIPVLKSVVPGLPTMKPTTAIAFLASGFSLAARCVRERGARAAGMLGAALVLAIGCTSLIAYATGTEVVLDRWLFAEALRGDPAHPTGRMAIPTALGFTVAGVALLLAHGRRTAALAQWPSFAVFAIALITFTGYAYHVPVLGRFAPSGQGTFTDIALHTTLGLLALAAAIPCTAPEVGLVGLLRERGIAGRWARWSLPWVVVVPLIGSWARLQGERRGLYGGDLGTAIFTVANILLMASLLWAGTVKLARSARDRDRARRNQRTVERSFRHMVETMQEGVWMLDRHATITYANQRLAELLGGTPGQLVGRTLWDFIPAEGRAESVRRFEEHRRGIRGAFDVRMRRLDGAPRWALVSSNPFFADDGTFLGTLAAITDIHERKQAEERQRHLIDELDHRVKNTLATVLATLDESLETAPSPEDFRDTFESRVRIVARTHEALARQGWAELPLAEVVEVALAPLAPFALLAPDEPRVLVHPGTNARVPASIVTPVAMALGELARDAARHGALAEPAGRLEIAWRVEDHGRVTLDWIERGAARPPRAPHTADAVELARELVRGQVGGELELRTAERGLEARLTFELDPDERDERLEGRPERRAEVAVEGDAGSARRGDAADALDAAGELTAT